MPREWRMRLEDILEAIERVRDFTHDMDPVVFASDLRTRQAVTFNLLVIGEAASRIPTEVTSRHPEVPWAAMRGIRNLIAHQYFDVQPETVWRTAVEDLPPLLPSIRAILDSST